MSTPQDTGKIAAESSFIGQEGINLIERIVLAMRHKWQTIDGHNDLGIDGHIEICRDTEDGKRVGTNFIIQVQSKARDREWSNEDDNGFTFTVDERDLRHWMNGNNPVILVVSRPSTNEAYWVPIKEYFSTLEARKTRAIYFKKRLHRFGENADLSLLKLAIPAQAAVGIQPAKKYEQVETNLLPLRGFPRTIYYASTRFRKGDALRAKAKMLAAYPGRSWFLKWKKVYSFNAFETAPWPKLINRKSKGDFAAERWAKSPKPEDQGDFVRLLNEALAEFLAGRDLMRLRLKRDTILYYFAPQEPGIETEAKWGDSATGRTVVQKIPSKKDPTKIVCYRHHAIIPHFLCFGGRWFLTVEPTYHFTTNGKEPYPLREDYLSGMKRLEKHQAVHNNVRFWAYWLTHQDLIEPRKENLVFAAPESFTSEYGIIDSDWLAKADDEERDNLGLNANTESRSLAIDGSQLVLL